MAMATVLSRAQHGLDAPLVRVEVDLGSGLPRFTIVGLPETVVRESKDRVHAAIVNSRFEMPDGRITVNLSPADLPKEGGRFDLPIAIGILLASGQLPNPPLQCCELYGELSLGGEVQPVRGTLLAAVAAARMSQAMIVPLANIDEARLVNGAMVAGAKHLLEVAAHAHGTSPLDFVAGSAPTLSEHAHPDLSDVRGQAHAKRALEIAAAGSHSLLMIGPPGTGKSMLAQRLPGLLPALSEAEALEVAAVRSLGGIRLETALWRIRPFRSPHHTASAVALVGGGSVPRPGEVSLAHRGVLFLDELPEFDRRVLEVLREPLETGTITISRAARQAEFPAAFQLVAAMNPCPCGYLGDVQSRCRCTSEQIQRYRARLSGPLIDRLDLHIEVPRLPVQAMHEHRPTVEATAGVAKRVQCARRLQESRQGVTNARLPHHAIERHCQATRPALALLERAANTLGFSARVYHRILKVARTIADLGESEVIDRQQMGEAIALRALDRRS